MIHTGHLATARGTFGSLALRVGVWLLLACAPARLSAEPLERAVLVSVDGLTSVAVAGGACPQLARFVAAGVGGRAVTSPASAYAGWVELLTGAGADVTGVRDERDGAPKFAAPALAASLARAGVRTLALPADPLAHARGGLARGFTRWEPSAPALDPGERADSASAWLRRPGRAFAWLAFSTGAASDPWRRADGVGPVDTAARFARLREIDVAFARFVRSIEADGDRRPVLVVVVGCGRPAAGSALQPQVPIAAQVVRGHGAVRTPARLAGVASLIAETLGAVHSAPVGASPRPQAPATDPLGWPGCAGPAAWAWCVSPGAPTDSSRFAGLDSLLSRCGGMRLALERDLALSRAGRERESAPGLKAAVEAMPGDARVALAYADHLLRHGRFEIVEPVLAGIPERDPFAALARWRVVMAEAARLDFAAARRDAVLAAALASPSPAASELPVRLAVLETFADSVAARPDDGRLHLRYGRALVEAELFVPAYSQFHAARALLAGNPEPDVALAAALLDQGRPQHAWPVLQRAFAVAPDDAPAHALAGEVLLAMGREGEARAHWDLVEHWPGLEPRLLYNLACLRAAAGEREAAIAALEHAFERGYLGWSQLANDPDLAAVRADARVRALLARAPAADR